MAKPIAPSLQDYLEVIDQQDLVGALEAVQEALKRNSNPKRNTHLVLANVLMQQMVNLREGKMAYSAEGAVR